MNYLTNKSKKILYLCSMIRKTLLVLSLLALFTSCDNDLNIIADWKDVPSVYGVLNAEDSVHYIKLNKAFLGQGDVMMMAQEFDSLYYGEDIVGLRLIKHEQNNNGEQSFTSIELETTDEFVKPEGIFNSPTQIIYKTSEELYKDTFYALEVYRKSNDTIIAQTENPIRVLSPVAFIKPNTISALPIAPNSYVSKISWRSVEGGNMYEVSMRFNYIEFPISGGSDTLYKSIEFDFPTLLSSDSEGGESMSYPIDYLQFLSFIAANIPNDPSVRRLTVGDVDRSSQGVSGFAISHACLDFTLRAAGSDLSTYLVLNENSSSLVLDRPEYSNIENGVGILSSKTIDTVIGAKITNSSNDEITTNELTKHLNFGSFELNGDNQIEITYEN